MSGTADVGGTAAARGPRGVRCRAVTVVLGRREVLRDLSLEVRGGEMVALLGASGAGKTTLLGALAGFVPLAAGEIEIDGVFVASPARSVPPERRRIGVVFQDYALWPQMTARQIVAYPLAVRGVPRREAEARADGWLARVGLDGMGDRRPGQLSGGQQQRVGLARALISEPGLLLCDEPTANLDAVLRGGLQQEIREQQRRSGAAGVYVTHDPAEAFDVADRVAVLDQGRLAQVGPPAEIYARPASEAVASLTGAYSLVRAEALAGGGVRVCGIEIEQGVPQDAVPGSAWGAGPVAGSGSGSAAGAGPRAGSGPVAGSGAGSAAGAGLGAGPGAGSGAGSAAGAGLVAGSGAGFATSAGSDSGAGAGARAQGVVLLLRPEWLEIGMAGGPGLPARVRSVRYRGGFTDYDLDTAAGKLVGRTPGEPRWCAGTSVACMPRRGWVMPEQPARPPRVSERSGA